MALDEKGLQHLLNLARLECEPKTADSLKSDLNNIMNMIEKISSANTQNVSGDHTVASQRFRDDVVSEPDNRKALLALSPKTEADLFLVPTILE